MPVVMDELNFIKNIHHHYRAYGGWSFALEDYIALNFTAQIDNPRTQLLMDIVDPFAYRERLTMPKLVINSCASHSSFNDVLFLSVVLSAFVAGMAVCIQSYVATR